MSAKGQGLVPIDEVARQLGLRASALRYYEQRQLVEAVSRHSGRRWYGASEVRRLAVIRYWQESALLSLDQIADMLAGPGGRGRWSQAVEDHIDALDRQIERMTNARELLGHVLAHHRGSSPDGCPHYETLIWSPSGTGHPGHHDMSSPAAVS